MNLLLGPRIIPVVTFSLFNRIFPAAMGKLLRSQLLIFLLLPAYMLYPQQKVMHLGIDSLEYNKNLWGDWLFYNGNAKGAADTGYDDSHWVRRKPSLMKYQDTFKGLGWMRFHFTIDSTLVNVPMALSIAHYGASEIYLDGKKYYSWGKIADSNSSVYYNPQFSPMPIYFNTPGRHLLAVKYANFNAKKNYRIFKETQVGFLMVIGKAQDIIDSYDQNKDVVYVAFSLLVGFFLALSAVHFLIFLFNHSYKSHLYYSIFTLCLGSIFLFLCIESASKNSELSLWAEYVGTPLLSLACLALSLFIGQLFKPKKPFRKWIAFILTILSLTLKFTGSEYAALANIILIGWVSLESVAVIVIALFRRVKGTWIIGTGILFTALFMLLIIALIAYGGGYFAISGDNLMGTVLFIAAALSIVSIPISMSLYLAWSFANVNRNLVHQLDEVQRLSEINLQQEQEKQKLLENRKEELEKEVSIRTEEVIRQKSEIESQNEQLKSEKKKSDDLLLNILPEQVASELKETGSAEAKLFSDVTVLFIDFVGFTTISESMSPKELVAEIDFCFKEFDSLTSEFGLEKIKTVGDAYIVAAGLPNPQPDHATLIVKTAIAMRNFMNKYRAEREAQQQVYFDFRIGINSGSVVAGIVGVKKFAYDIWGDTVNTAARMEQNSEPGKINISGSTYALVKDNFICTHRGKIEAKNKGAIDMYFVED